MVGATIPTQGAETAPLRVAVGIATSGRAAVLGETLLHIEDQTLPADAVLVLYGKPEDIAELPARFPAVRFLLGSGGLCDKRNRILDELGVGSDALLFLDDDFLLDAHYLQTLEKAFRSDPALVGATGTVLADGINGPGLSVAEGRDALTRTLPPQAAEHTIESTYGCNMAFRLRPIREHNLRFDAALPLYAWYEDIDFSRRMGVYGSMRRLRDARGVHLGTKAGRISGQRLGYSQVANPIYLWRKGTYPGSHAVRSIGRNFLANLLRWAAPEPFVDRRGRMRGNLRALGDLLRRRLHPTRILEL